MLYFSLENEESKPFRQRLTSVGVSPFGFGKNVNLVLMTKEPLSWNLAVTSWLAIRKMELFTGWQKERLADKFFMSWRLSSECDYSMAKRTRE